MNTKTLGIGIILAALFLSGITTAAVAHNAGDSGIAYPGVPCVTPISGGDCVNVYTYNNTLEAATIGWSGYEEGVAYAGRPFISVYIY